MKGFEIIKNDEAPIYVGVEYGSVSVSVNMALNSNKAYLLVRGNDAESVTKWIAQDMKKGDRIKVRFTDIEAVSQIISKELKNREELEERYLELKRELEEKGII